MPPKPKTYAYKSKLERMKIAKEMNQSVDTVNENDNQKEPF